MSAAGRPPLGRPVQIAYAVADVRAAARHRAETTGAGPFVVVDHIPLASARVDGARRRSTTRRPTASGATSWSSWCRSTRHRSSRPGTSTTSRSWSPRCQRRWLGASSEAGPSCCSPRHRPARRSRSWTPGPTSVTSSSCTSPRTACWRSMPRRGRRGRRVGRPPSRCARRSPIAGPQRASSASLIQLPWKPCGTRRGRWTRATGSAAGSVASRMTRSERSVVSS